MTDQKLFDKKLTKVAQDNNWAGLLSLLNDPDSAPFLTSGVYDILIRYAPEDMLAACLNIPNRPPVEPLEAWINSVGPSYEKLTHLFNHFPQEKIIRAMIKENMFLQVDQVFFSIEKNIRDAVLEDDRVKNFLKKYPSFLKNIQSWKNIQEKRSRMREEFSTGNASFRKKI